MKHGVSQLFILFFITGCFTVQAAPYEFTPFVQDTTTRYGYWSGDSNQISASSPKSPKTWKVFGMKIPIYTPPKRMERGIVKSLFIPEKTWQTGISFSHYEENNDDYDFLIIENWKGKAYSFRVSPFFCWYFKDNLGVGGRFTYKNTRFNIRELSISIEDDMSFILDNAYVKNEMYQCAAFIRNYVGLHPRIGVFNETHLTYGYGKGWLSIGNTDLPNYTSQTTHEIQLGIRPGICGFVTNSVMLEFSFEVGGLRYRKISQIINDETKGSRSTGIANFKLNLLSLNLGLAVCI